MSAMTFIHRQLRFVLMTPIAVLIGVISALALVPASAGAGVLSEGELASFGEYGSGAGQLNVGEAGGGIAADPTSGHVFIADSGNNRIDEFTAWGVFVKSWGWDAVATGPDDSAPDTVEEVKIAAAGGSFTLGLADPFATGFPVVQRTAPIPYNASTGEVKSALEALAAVGGHGGTVSVSGGPGNPSGSSPYVIAFEGALAGDRIAKLEIDGGGLQLPVGSQLRCAGTNEAATAIIYRWLGNGVPIAGATASTYTPTAADAGKAIQCEATATNSEAIFYYTHVSPARVMASAPAGELPKNPSAAFNPPGVLLTSSAPLEVGKAGGQTLTCDPNELKWTGSPSFTYRWLRNGTPIAGAIASTYTVTTANLVTAATFQCVVAAANAAGTVSMESDAVFTLTSGPLAYASVSVTVVPQTQSTTEVSSEGGGPEVCRAANGDTCKVGIAGVRTGQLNKPTGIAVAPGGEVYVYEADNHRLQAFDHEGNFVRSVGGDVIAHGPGNSANDETQEITVAASSGTFKLSFADPFGEGEEEQTPSLPYNASASEVEAALNGLATIGGLGGSVTVSGGPGSPTGSAPYEVSFEGNLAGDDLPQLKLDRSVLGPATIGARLVCSSETEAESVTYQWLRNGAPIGGATSPIYVTTATDEGKAIQCLAATHFAETGMAQVTNPAYVAPPVPGTAVPVAPGSIDSPQGGLPFGGSGGTLKCDPNANRWQGAISFSYSWYRNGARIGGATAQTYVATPADVAEAASFQCGVTASNSGGSTTGLSNGASTYQPQPHDRIFVNDPPIPSVNMEPVRTLVQGGGPEVCSAAAGDACKAGRRGSAGGEFALEAGPGVLRVLRGDNLDIAPGGTIYVGDWGRIQKLAAGGTFESSIPLARPLWYPAYPMPQALSLGPEGDVFVAFRADVYDRRSAPAYRLTPSGTARYSLPVTAASGLAAGAGGVAFASDRPPTYEDEFLRLREVDPAGKLLTTCCIQVQSNELRELPALATNVVTAAGGMDLYVAHIGDYKGVGRRSFIEILGAPPAKWPAPPAQPIIDAEYASSVGEGSAVLGAEINPVFWADTHFRVEYGSEDCSGGGCKALPERQLGAGVVKRDVASKGVVVSGLTPGTTYHYRFRAESSGGGPVYGPDRTFTTFTSPEQADSSCSNQELRSGASAALPDCRAFEMVSPVDKEGADLSTFVQINGFPARLDQGSASGDKATYSASTAFGDAPSAPYSAQYLSTRGQGGWSTAAVSPPQESGSILPDNGLDSPFKAFSEDLSSGWLVVGSEPPLAPGGLEGFGNLYRRDNDGAEYEALTTAEPLGVEAGNFYPTLLGFSADGSRSFFRANGKLTPDASAKTEIEQTYEAHEGELHLVSVKPNGKAATAGSTVGARRSGLDDGREGNVATAVSEDGSLVYWTEENPSADKLYLRVEGTETVAVSGNESASFRLASPDGERALYEEGGKLKRFDAETRTSSTLVSGGMLGVLGASHDLSRIYFATTEKLVEGATAGKPNLYLYEDGASLRFIATLGSNESPQLNTEDRIPPVALNTEWHFARVTPDGQVAIFMSRKALSGAENIDRSTGEEDAEVFRYDASAEQLACISCPPTGARPAGGELKLDVGGSGYFYAAKIPGAELQFHQPRVLSTDGGRVFFDSLDRLVPTDTNGRQDVYQWEAEGKGECSDPSARGYDPASAGCVTLISDGRGSTEAEFIDASADGSNAFFFTGTSLLPQDSGQIDVYDARVNGGFPQPPAPLAQCEGEACQPPFSPPAEPPYASQGYHGPGNPKQTSADKKKKAKKHKKAKRHHKARRANKTGGKR